jgi:hypothetical protein
MKSLLFDSIKTLAMMEHCQTVSDGANQTVYGSKSDRFSRRMDTNIELDLIPVQSTKIIT